MDEFAALRAISPLDGRYGTQLFSLSDYFSEYGLFKYRLLVEVEYLIELSRLGLPQMPALEEEDAEDLRRLISEFSLEDAAGIKRHERVTNHDVKALEYFIRDKLGHLKLEGLMPWVHFSLTSQDVNNTAVPLSLKAFILSIYLPLFQSFIDDLVANAHSWMNIPMLGRTHGQPASPTVLGKEIAVFVERLDKQLQKMSQFQFEGKFGGATGNFNAHRVAFPSVDWVAFGNVFLKRLGLQRQQTTTQIEHYDSMAELFDIIGRINTILLDFCRDMWSYISFNYFQITVKAGEVGSSAMPHKVNPIDFENAEGNIGLANALLQYMAIKLPVSRLQRDLSDSTVLRSLGVPMGHAVLALNSAKRGLAKCTPNRAQIAADLDANAVVLAEAYQVILRREGVPEGYEILKSMTRNNARPTLADMHAIVDQLPIGEEVKEELRQLTPAAYIGILPAAWRT